MALYDVVILGGGPAGLQAALTLGRARKRVLVCDVAGDRRNAAAEHVHNFVTRDGTPPLEFRRIAREQLAPYTSVEQRDIGVAAVSGERGAFAIELTDGTRVETRRVLLCTGMSTSGYRCPVIASCGAAPCSSVRTVTDGKCAISAGACCCATRRWRSSR